MNTRRSQRIRRATVEQLLHGAQVEVPDPLARMLASAAAPPRPGELAREDTAVAAFHAARLAPVAASRREQMVTRPLARLLTTKVAALAVVICTTGGIALAATLGTGAPHGSGPARGPLSAGEGGPGPATAGAPPAGRPGANLSGRATKGLAGAGPGAPAVASVPVARLCLALTSDVHAILTARPGSAAYPPASAGRRFHAHAGRGAGQPGSASARQHGAANAGQHAATSAGPRSLDARGRAQALASPVVRRVLGHRAFPGLTTTAGGAANVPDLCALALGLPALPDPQRLASLPAPAFAAVAVASLARLPRGILARLPGPALAKLPMPVLRQLPVPALARLPGPVLAKLPVTILGRLPARALAKLPLSVLAKLPASVQAKLPGYIRARLAAAELSRVPAPALAKLPVSVLALLPAPVLAGLPAAVRSLLPPSLLASMPDGL